MTDKITAWLDEAQATADSATEGPWAEVGRDDPLLPPGAVTTAGKPGYRQIICEHASFDAAFIADARTRLPQAIAALRAVLDAADEFQPHIVGAIRDAAAAALGISE